MPFSALITFKAKSIAFVHGKLEESYALGSDYIEALLSRSKDY